MSYITIRGGRPLRGEITVQCYTISVLKSWDAKRMSGYVER